MKLSVLIPGIRRENWLKLYDSISKAVSYEDYPWEVIIISPYELPPELARRENVVWLQSWRSPIACQQQGLCSARGEYITWAADDGVYLQGSLNTALKTLEGKDYKDIVIGKYFEGENPVGMDNDWYYHLYNHDSCKLPYVPRDALMLNCGLVSRRFVEELGGWDSVMFEVCPFAYNDFAIRAYKSGAIFSIQKEIMFKCSHEPGMMGTHGPIHLAQTEHDEGVFRLLYLVDYLPRLRIDLNNYKNTPEIWTRRFGGGK